MLPPLCPASGERGAFFLPSAPLRGRGVGGEGGMRPGRQEPLPRARALWYITRGAAIRSSEDRLVPRDERRSLWEVHTVASVEERVIDIVCENLGVNKEQVTRQTSFQEDVGADSLDIVELVMELEEEFEITIPDEQAEKIKTVGEAIDYIEREQAKK
jgi:acyl carrier protein